jgi:hypothetical protein
MQRELYLKMTFCLHIRAKDLFDFFDSSKVGGYKANRLLCSRYVVHQV